MVRDRHRSIGYRGAVITVVMVVLASLFPIAGAAEAVAPAPERPDGPDPTAVAPNLTAGTGADDEGDSYWPADVEYVQVEGECGLRASGTIDCWRGGVPAVPVGTALTAFSLGGFWTEGGPTHNVRFGCGVEEDTSLVCWGVPPWSSPGQRPPEGAGFASVKVDGRNGCALAATGFVQCWGGIADPGDAGPFIGIDGAGSTWCGLTAAGSIECWMNSTGSSPGAGPFRDAAIATSGSCTVALSGALTCVAEPWTGLASPPAGSFTAVDIAGFVACAARTDGNVVCWGTGASEVTVEGPFVEVSTACGIRTDGSAACWSEPWQSALDPPDGEFVSIDLSPYVGPVVNGNADPDASPHYGCAVSVEQAVVCWGAGIGEVAPPSGTFTYVATGSQRACALRTDKTVACWGEDGVVTNGGLDLTYDSLDVARLVPCGIVAADAPEHAGLGACGSGTLDTVGQSVHATMLTRVNQGTFATDEVHCRIQSSPIAWIIGAGSPGVSFSSLCFASGAFEQVDVAGFTQDGLTDVGHACALRTDDSVHCWGTNTAGQATPPAGAYTDVAVGGTHSCAVRADQTVACWGQDMGAESAPAGTFADVAAAPFGSCGVTTDGAIECWGPRNPPAPDGQITSDEIQVSPEYLYPSATATLWIAVKPDGDAVLSPDMTVTLRQDGSPSISGTVMTIDESGTLAQISADTSALTGEWSVHVLLPGGVESDPLGPLEIREHPLRIDDRTMVATPGASLRVWGLGPDGTLTLRRNGTPDRPQVSRQAQGDATIVSFDLGSAPLGVWEVVISRPGRPDSTDTVEVVAHATADVRAELWTEWGFRPDGQFTFYGVRPGLPTGFEIQLSNYGPGEARLIPVLLTGFPEGTEVELLGVSDALGSEVQPVLDADDGETEIAYANDAGELHLPLLVSSLRSGDMVRIRVGVTVPVDFESADVTVVVSHCADPFALAAGSGAGFLETLNCIDSIVDIFADKLISEVVSGGPCVELLASELSEAFSSFAGYSPRDRPIAQVASVTGMVARVTRGVACVVALAVPQARLGVLLASAVADGFGIMSEGAALANGCLLPLSQKRAEFEGVASIDPNRIVGPSGATAAHAIDGAGELEYRIDFENLPDATAAAQVVVIDDHLDPSVYDLDTLEFGQAAFGDTLVAGSGPFELDRTVSAGDASPWLVRVQGRLVDPGTGHVQWTFSTVDPQTGEAPLDPFAGFLPPNDESGQGEGSVSFSVALLEPDEGDVVENQASIVFDLNEPIVTNVWSNLIDGTPPVSSVEAGPVNGVFVPLDVTAEDGASGIGRVDLWVSEDGAPPIWFGSTFGDSYPFVGEPGRDYEFFSVAVDGAGNAEAAPIAPDSDASVTSSFSDVPDQHGFAFPIMWMAAEGITGGYTDGTFRPGAAISRQAMAAFLYRLAGEPEWSAPTVSPFSDVPVSHPFYGAITWMASEGITGGYTDGTFRPGAAISRQAMAAFLYRLAGEPEWSAPTVSPFSDVPASHQFYGSITWMASEGVTGGYTDGTFRPQTAVSRQAMAAFLYRYADGPGPTLG